SQDKSNVTSFKAMALAIVTLQAFAGMWINAFIVFVLCIALVKKRSFNSNEKILLFLGCSRFWYLCIIWVHIFILTIYPGHYYVHPIPQLFAAIQTFLNFSNTWVPCCLSVFYCIKIATFRHIIFTYLKANVDRIVPWLLLGSVLFSLIISILAYKVNDEVHFNNPNVTISGNLWKTSVNNNAYFFPAVFITGFGFVTAFLAVIFSALLLLFSLWRHKRKMQANSVKNISVDAHIKAMKSILSSLFFYSINFTCLILSLIYATKKNETMTFVMLIFLNAFPAVHSLVLIFSNPKLEKTLLRTLLCVKCKVCRR
ncbi:TA2R9 protein, partial [Crotophaga sulcirostris]|nr:TA2R9 protein [Crotophaga sulcirostris]